MKGLISTIFTLLISFSLSATITWSIGAAETYTSIANAWAAFPSPISDDYVLEIRSDYTQESLPITLTAVNGASASYTITNRPQTGVAGLSLLATTESQVFYFNGVDYVIIDGRPGGSGSGDFTLENSSTANDDYVIQYINDATYNTVKYCNINGSNAITIKGNVYFSTASSGGNDNNTIDNCVFDESGANKPACHIYSSGSASNSNSDNTISNCEFTEFSAYGINLTTDNNDSWSITSNSFYQDASFTL